MCLCIINGVCQVGAIRNMRQVRQALETKIKMDSSCHAVHYHAIQYNSIPGLASMG